MLLRRLHFPLVVTLLMALHSSSAPAVGGDFAAFDPAAVLVPPATAPTELYAADMNRLISTQTMLIRLQATEYQRKIAASRARAYVAAQRRAEAEPAPAKQSTASTKSGKKGKVAAAKKPEQPEEKKVVSAQKKKLPRYIAVDTVKDKRSGPEVKKVVMLWDTQSESLVGNNLYEVQNPAPVGTTTKFETYSANYIGAGL